MGIRQMEGGLQGQMDLCQRHPEHQPPPHSPKVSQGKPDSSSARSNIRHSSNTQERKPVTNSRDTQELLPEAGQEMLRIFYTHPARTSLLQDFAFYEVRTFYSPPPILTFCVPSSKPCKRTRFKTCPRSPPVYRVQCNQVVS